MSDRPPRRALVLLLSLLAVAVLGASGCRNGSQHGGAKEPTLAADQFVTVYVALREAERQSATEAEFEARRAEILDRAGISQEALLDFVDSHAADLDLMASVWDSIRTRLERADSAGGA